MVHKKVRETDALSEYERKLDAEWKDMTNEMKSLEEFGEGASREGESVVKEMEDTWKEMGLEEEKEEEEEE